MKLAVGAHYHPPFMYTQHVDFLTEALLTTQRGIDGEVRWMRGNGWCSATRHNNVVEAAQRWGADWLCFFDPDQLGPADLFLRLLSHQKPIVSALVPSRGPVTVAEQKPFQPWAFLADGAELIPLKPKTGLQRATHMGTGCLLMDMRVFDKLSRPYFQESIDPKTFRRRGAMDVYFVAKLLKETGLALWVDTDIEGLKHLDIFPIDDTFSDRFPEGRG